MRGQNFLIRMLRQSPPERRLSKTSYFLLVCLRLHLRHLLLLHLVLHPEDQLVYVCVFDLVFVLVHCVLDHFVDCFHALLFCHVGFHGFLELLHLHLVFGISHDVGHAAHDILHCLHSPH